MTSSTATAERDPRAARLENLQRLRNDLELYAAQCLKIRTKTGHTIPLRFNEAQRYIHSRLEEQKARTGKVRALILKGRQQGASTYIGARYYHRSAMRRGIQVYILTHEQDATNNLFGMVERYHKHNPLKPSTGASNAKELTFDRLDSGYSVGTAGASETGRSKTTQLFHGSEAAFWKNAKSHFAGVVQTIPDLPDTESILESTGNGIGNEFHERWQLAEAGIGDYQAIFVPWFWSQEYRRPVPPGFDLDAEEIAYQAAHGLDLAQMAWRRAKIIELKDPLLFMQEYPATPQEAFQATGHDSLIKPDVVIRARKANLEGVGPLVVGVDPKRDGTDRFAIAWRRGRKVEKVESDPAPIDTLRAAAKIKDIIDTDSPAKVFIDAGGGAGIYDVLVSWGAPYDKVCVLVSFGSAPIMPPKVDENGKVMAGPANRRAEMWMLSRDWLEDEGGADIPDTDALQSDACAPGYHYDTLQRTVLTSKEQMRAKGIRSPDEWDAIALTFAEPVKEERPKARSARPRRRRRMDGMMLDFQDLIDSAKEIDRVSYRAEAVGDVLRRLPVVEHGCAGAFLSVKVGTDGGPDATDTAWRLLAEAVDRRMGEIVRLTGLAITDDGAWRSIEVFGDLAEPATQ